MSNVVEPDNEQACWRWRRRVDREGYGIIDLYVPGLRKNATLKAHILAWVIIFNGEELSTANELYLAYKELTSSGLQLDHLCRTRCCINPDHTEAVPHIVNQHRRDHAIRSRKARAQLF